MQVGTSRERAVLERLRFPGLRRSLGRTLFELAPENVIQQVFRIGVIRLPTQDIEQLSFGILGAVVIDQYPSVLVAPFHRLGLEQKGRLISPVSLLQSSE